MRLAKKVSTRFFCFALCQVMLFTFLAPAIGPALSQEGGEPSETGSNDTGTPQDSGNSTDQAGAAAAQQPLYLPLVEGTSSGGQIPVPPPTPPPNIPRGGSGWPMAGANPQRTSWTADEVRGELRPDWYKPFEAYIMPKTQIIAEYNRLYISTANGLYCLDAENGNELWVYPTEMPLGNSPTVVGNVAYVGGYDKKLHAVDAITGQGLWTFEAGAGFDANPLVVDDKVFLGSRDGFFYAVYASGSRAGQLAWKFETGGPISFSAAYQSGTLYFASDDSRAYALNSGTGELVWKTDLLPGAGFHSWWPVVYGDWVIFAGSSNYRNTIPPGPVSRITHLDLETIYPNHLDDPKGTLPGPIGAANGAWANGTPTIDLSKSTTTPNGKTMPVTEYLEQKPWRRSYLVLNKANGAEYTTDFDGDGNPEYAPILWVGTKSGNRYPPVVGADGVLYQTNNYLSSPAIAGGNVSGWQIGTPYISVISADWVAVDEPQAYAAGGNLIYNTQCCDRAAGAVDITIPNKLFLTRYENGVRPPTSALNSEREWVYFAWLGLPDVTPGYDAYYYNGTTKSAYSVYGGRNGVYGVHGNQNPPIPYQGRVYVHRSNSVIAFAAPNNQAARALPTAKIVPVQDAVPAPGLAEVQARLQGEVEKILAAGHLRPGYQPHGIFDFKSSRWCGDELVDYWHLPGDVLVTLIRALPYLPADLQTRTKAYLQSEFSAYPPAKTSHIGWNSGTAREPFLLPQEVQSDMAYYAASANANGFAGWTFPPQNFYAMWKYAEVFGNAKAMFDAAKGKLAAVPADNLLANLPNVHNDFINGYMGYLELQKLAGYPESANVRQDLNRLLNMRVSNFSKDTPDSYFQNQDLFYCRALSVSRNFMDMTPELAAHLRANALAKVQAAISEYDRVAPYWFVSKFDTTLAEGASHPWFDYHALFQAKALILQQPAQELAQYIDIPAVPVGDLYYIDNLVAVLEAGK
jgi:outer membrane protein assembly factor BamB